MIAAPLRIFVCSPLRPAGGYTLDDNLAYARALGLAVIKSGNAPFVPHLLYTQFLDDDDALQRAAGIAAGLAYLKICDEIWVAAQEYETCSSGMRSEIDFAQKFSRGEPPIPLIWTEYVEVRYMPEPFKTVRRPRGGGWI